MQKCPACGHGRCASGNLAPSDSDDPLPSKFYPAGAQDWAIRPGVRLRERQRLHCCLRCGLVFSHVDPKALDKIVVGHVGLKGWSPVETYATGLLAPACPSCKAGRGVPGGLIPYFDSPIAATFHPDGSRYWEWTPGTQLDGGNIMFACATCGLTWAHVQVGRVWDILEKLGVPRGEVPVRASRALYVLRRWAFMLATAIVATAAAVAYVHFGIP
jgi:hypothetical protein